jgi:hypothetical protein
MAGAAFWRQATLAFAAGALGGVALFVFLWLIGTIGIPQAIGINLPVNVTKAYLYNRIVWGGIWGFIFLVPWKQSWWVRGLVFSVGPSLATFLIFLPSTPAGLFGLGLGALTPLLVLVANGVWGLATAWWLEFVGARTAAA